MTSVDVSPGVPTQPAPAQPQAPVAPATPVAPPGYAYKLVEQKPNVLAELFSSKKFIALLLGLALTLLTSFGVKTDDVQRQELLNLIMAYLGAQGIADAGKSFAQVKARTNATNTPQP